MTSHASGMPRIHARVSLTDIDRANRLLADYLAQDATVLTYFSHPPAAMPQVAREARAGAERARLADALVAYQQHIGADATACDAARLLADPATPVVTVGQQPGLLTGPLYTPYKALTAINLSHRLSRELGRPAVPVFWIGADDDDRAEVDHCGWWGSGESLQVIRYPEMAGKPGQLVGDVPVDCFGEVVLEQLEPLLTGLPFAGEVRAVLQETRRTSADFGEWFARLMARLFSHMGLVLCDSRLPEVRRLAAGVIRREIATPLATTAAVNAQARALHKHGYRPALTKPEDVSNFFLLEGGIRQRVRYTGGVYDTTHASWSPEGLLALLDREPERFLPNAVLRPVVQEYLFGSAAFVAGPNELGYWAQLRPVFAALQVPMPPVIPRAAATLMPAKATRQLSALNLSPLALLHEFDQTRVALLEQANPAMVDAFTQARADVARLVATVTAHVAGIEPTLAQSALATQQKMLNELERLERKALKAVERRSSEHSALLEYLRETLFPGHGVQERTLNLFSVLSRSGFSLLESLRVLLDGQEGCHLFVEL